VFIVALVLAVIIPLVVHAPVWARILLGLGIFVFVFFFLDSWLHVAMMKNFIKHAAEERWKREEEDASSSEQAENQGNDQQSPDSDEGEHTA
jgi:hypothetical protein